MTWPLDATDLSEPYASDPDADAKCDAARSEIRGALRSSPAGYQYDDAAILSDAETAAELLEAGISLAHYRLSQGRGGVARKIAIDYNRARKLLQSIRDGSRPLSLPRQESTATASRRAVTVAGSTESEIPGVLDAWDLRVGGV